MAYDITQRRALETGVIKLNYGDGSPLLDDEQNRLSITAYGPGSKVWRQAHAEMNRKRTERLKKNGGKMDAAMEDANADAVDFLARVTVSFNGWDYPVPEGQSPQEMFRAAYGDDLLGYIRDHVYAEVNDWAAFMKGSATS